MSKLKKIAFEEGYNKANDKFFNKIKEISDKEIKDRMYDEFVEFFQHSKESPKEAHIDFMQSGIIQDVLEELAGEEIIDIGDPRVEELFDLCAEYAI